MLSSHVRSDHTIIFLRDQASKNEMRESLSVIGYNIPLEEKLIPIYTLKNLVEAVLIKDLLSKEGITAIIRSFDDRAYNGIFIPQKGYGEVWVMEKDKERAEEIIQRVLQ